MVHALGVVQKMKIHHTIHVPQDYPDLEKLKSYLEKEYSSDLHEFEFDPADVARPTWWRTDTKGVVAITRDHEGIPKAVHSDFGVREQVSSFS